MCLLVSKPWLIKPREMVARKIKQPGLSDLKGDGLVDAEVFTSGGRNPFGAPLGFPHQLDNSFVDF